MNFVVLLHASLLATSAANLRVVTRTGTVATVLLSSAAVWSSRTSTRRPDEHILQVLKLVLQLSIFKYGVFEIALTQVLRKAYLIVFFAQALDFVHVLSKQIVHAWRLTCRQLLWRLLQSLANAVNALLLGSHDGSSTLTRRRLRLRSQITIE